eukprot:950615-Rhodomonas_salina.1
MGRLIGSSHLLAVLCVSIFGLIEQASGGIHGLAPLLNKEAPGCCRERTLQKDRVLSTNAPKSPAVLTES